MFMNICLPWYEAWKKEENTKEKRAGPKEPVSRWPTFAPAEGMKLSKVRELQFRKKSNHKEVVVRR